MTNNILFTIISNIWNILLCQAYQIHNIWNILLYQIYPLLIILCILGDSICDLFDIGIVGNLDGKSLAKQTLDPREALESCKCYIVEIYTYHMSNNYCSNGNNHHHQKTRITNDNNDDR